MHAAVDASIFLQGTKTCKTSVRLLGCDCHLTADAMRHGVFVSDWSVRWPSTKHPGNILHEYNIHLYIYIYIYIYSPFNVTKNISYTSIRKKKVAKQQTSSNIYIYIYIYISCMSFFFFPCNICNLRYVHIPWFISHLTSHINLGKL